jgi:hypothetical protein
MSRLAQGLAVVALNLLMANAKALVSRSLVLELPKSGWYLVMFYFLMSI